MFASRSRVREYGLPQEHQPPNHRGGPAAGHDGDQSDFAVLVVRHPDRFERMVRLRALQ